MSTNKIKNHLLLAYTLNMDVVIYEVLKVYARYYQHVDSFKMIEDTVVKCKILKDDSPEFRHTV
jgi:hypothetical protein